MSELCQGFVNFYQLESFRNFGRGILKFRDGNLNDF